MDFAAEHNKALGSLASFGIGGVADHFMSVPASALAEAIAWARAEGLPFYVIGSATNIVFADRVPGLLIQVRGGNVRDVGDGELVADAGVPLQELVDAANARGYRGLETLAGIPGTVGGAVVGNAGAYGTEIKDTLVSVTTYNPDRRSASIMPKEKCGFAYRESRFKHELIFVTEARFRFEKGNPRELAAISGDIKKKRAEKYKPGLKCPGSFFKNLLAQDAPPALLEKIDSAKIIAGKIPAGYLLEEVGAKGMCAGDVCVSDFHGNLIVNNGTGVMADVRTLADKLKALVRERWGVTLHEEVRYL